MINVETHAAYCRIANIVPGKNLVCVFCFAEILNPSTPPVYCPYLLVGFDVRSAVVGHVRHAHNAAVEPAVGQRLQYLANLLVLA